MSGEHIECECPVEGHAPGCPNDRLSRSEIARLGLAYERLGRLMQQADSNIDDLAAAAWECGLRLEFRLVPKPPCQHVWSYSMGETEERCVMCGQRQAIEGYR